MIFWRSSRSAHLSLVILTLASTMAADAAPLDFETDVLPILQRSCIQCHGPEKQKSGYRLDNRDIAFAGGHSGVAAITAHDGAASQLVQRISQAEPSERMPPVDSTVPPLTTSEIALLTAWIDEGPHWPDAFAGEPMVVEPHWSFEPLVKPEVPGHADHPIDAFIHTQLASEGLTPSPPADKRALMRRVYHDLVGLPPTPEVLDTFDRNTDPDAYDQLVDHLLDSPRHGERWARHWLDTVHFADSHGYEHDLARDHAWRYRDYVIESFNNDTPWPRFIREQLAADYFYPEATNLTPALGFLGAGVFDLSTYITSTVTFDYLDRDDLVTQTTAAFLGTTANCARCHDHKFDPIPQEDYYALQAVFSGVLKGDVAYDADPDVAKERGRWTAILAAIDQDNAEELLAPEHEKLIRGWLEIYDRGVAWQPLDIATFLAAEGSIQTRSEDGAIVASGPRPDKETYTVTVSSVSGTITAIRLEVIAHDDLPMGGPGRADNGNLHLSEFEVRIFEQGASQSSVIPIRGATADFNQSDWGIERAIDGDEGTAWGIHPAVGDSHVAVFELEAPLTLSPGAHLAITLKQLHGGSHLIGAYRLSATSASPRSAIALPVAVSDALVIPEDDRSDAQRMDIAKTVLRQVARDALATLPEQAVVYAAAPAVEIPNGEPNPNFAALDAPKLVHLMARGDLDKPGEVVGPGALSALTHGPARFHLDEPSVESQRRAELANWIAHPDNPLTWRCIVNRVWHYHFGRGICDTPSDLGRMGGKPSHPELLDWLSIWFRDEAKGSLRELHRLIVTSETYQQSSAMREDAYAVDSDNRLLWRQNAVRLDADALRDYTLAASNRLDLTMGGPGDRYFTEGPGPQITPALDYDAFDWRTGDKHRRSIYRFVWRGIADPFLETLDFPDLGLLSPKRTTSVSSLQALALYNNDFILAQSEALARRIESEATSIDGQIDRATQLLWLRVPTPDEQRAFASFIGDNGLASFCRVLLNSNEFLFLE